ncbi:ISAs1 family transposase [Micromonospora sp. WMMA1363]|uniref:ISAs1 family transposase n=1 Tax=Micromonospora sp. WMMA1363 TaxID=3053985 RepID=UPI00259CD6CC|nr:ISAs1 family transposase [Micromonospora sp. WMMA1363]MDM4723203.1 ISAs1 family transposase [Micromonospora sp. WMMA1363]
MLSSSLIDPVVDHLADLALWEAELAAGPGAVDPLSVASSLVERLRQVPDPRRLRGLRHPLLVILVLTACATLVAGNDCVTAIRQWAARTPQDVLHRLGARRNPLTGRYLVPSERTFRRVLAVVDGDALDAATCGYAADVVRGDAPVPQVATAEDEPVEREQRRAVIRAVAHPRPAGLLPAAAIDGKLLHGARTADGKKVFLVAAVTHARAVILGQRQVPDKRGENAVIGDLLAPLDVAGMLLTLDALHTTKKTARLITGPLGAHYMLILKGNQPLALQAAHALLSGTDVEFADRMHVADDQGHGRTEHRTLRVADCDDTLFPGARQVFRLRRDTGGLDGVRTSKEIIHGIVSVTAAQADPEHLNHYARGHWTVENCLCATQRLVCIPGSAGRDWRDISGSDGLPGCRKAKGIRACQQTIGRVQA